MENKSSNKNLHKANQAKQDEFYTQRTDIENELNYYKDQFRNAVVYCNCDDPFESNFFKYFAASFNHLGLKKLIATSYFPSPITGGQLPLLEIEGLKPDGKEPFKIEINEVSDFNKDGAVDLVDIEWLLKHEGNVATPLKGNGDFRSDECIELLKQSDIVVTNPPFSLFREYVTQLAEYEKKFLIIGSLNAIKYNSIFKLIRNNKCWLGYNNGPKIYQIPKNYEQKNIFIGEDGKKYAKMGNTCWFTNLDISKRHEFITPYKKYTPEEYLKYDNYDAIEVSKLAEIPENYDGIMGVPITFLDKYNPDQFEILGIYDDKRENDNAFIQGVPTYVDEQHKRYVGPVIHGKALYTRILIKNKKVKK